MSKEYYAIVRWSTEDIHNHRQQQELVPWTEEQAEDWLADNELRMLDITISRGWDYIYDNLISMGEELDE